MQNRQAAHKSKDGISHLEVPCKYRILHLEIIWRSSDGTFLSYTWELSFREVRWLSEVTQRAGGMALRSTRVWGLSPSSFFLTHYTFGCSWLCFVLFCWCWLFFLLLLLFGHFGYLFKTAYCLFSQDSRGFWGTEVVPCAEREEAKVEPFQTLPGWNFWFLFCSYTMIWYN